MRLSACDSPTSDRPTPGESTARVVPSAATLRRCFAARKQEADEFYAAITPPALDADAANVMRQALAGMLWSKQFYHYDVDKWLEERGSDPFKPTRKAAPRNDHWHHMYNGDVISMPDKWEYPWYAAWDLAFHVLALTLVDPDFGKQQLKLMLREHYMHPNGQIPAYEWNFGDVNPPVHAWSTIFTYRLEKAQTGQGDTRLAQEQLSEAAAEFHLVGQPQGSLGAKRLRGRLPGPGQHRGLRSQRAAADRRLPGAGRRHRLDGALLPEHARNRRGAGADRSGLRGHGAQVLPSTSSGSPRRWCTLGEDTGMWDEEDGFFYDVLRLPDGEAQRLKVRSMVGCCRSARPRHLRENCWRRTPNSRSGSQWFLDGSARTLRVHPRPDEARCRGPPAGVDSGRSQAPPRAGEDARRERVSQPLRHPLAVALPRRPSLCHPCRRPGIPGVVPAGRVRYRHVRRQLELARAHLDARQRPDHPGLAPVLLLLRRRLHRRMPHGLRPADESVPGGRGDRAPAVEHLPEGQRRPPPGLSAEPGSSRRTRTGAITSCSTSISTATTGPAWAPATRPAGPGVIARTMHLFATLTPEKALMGGKKAYLGSQVLAELADSPVA